MSLLDKAKWDISVDFGNIAADELAGIFAGMKTVEVKRQDESPYHGALYIETSQNSDGMGYQPSGLSVSKADIQAYFIQERFVMLPTYWVREQEPHCIQTAANRRNDIPSRGFKLPLSSLFKPIGTREQWTH